MAHWPRPPTALALAGAASLCAIVIGGAPAGAQTPAGDAPLTLDPVIVEGSRLQQSTTEVGSSVSIITADDIKRQGFDFAVDAIASAPGVTINQNGAFGGQASVRIRGNSSDQTLVLIDGVVVNDPSTPGGGFDFSRLGTENIERIEILKGPQSTLWGADAIGGVVSITTKRGQQGFGGTVFGEYGSFNTFRGSGAATGGNALGDFRVAVTGIISDGISKADEDNGNPEEDAFHSLSLSGRGTLNLPADAQLDVSLLYTDARTEFDSFAFGAEGGVSDGDEVSETEEFSGSATLKVPLFGGRFQNILLGGYSTIDRENFFEGDPSFQADGNRTTFRYQGTFQISDAHKLAFGAEREETSANGEERAINGFFGLYEFKPIQTVTLTGGVRVDDDDTFGSKTTGRVAAAYNPTPQWTVRGSWGQGFKPPTLFQSTFFCCGATSPNSDLEAETSEAFDVGVDFQTRDRRGALGVTYFNQDTDNLITFSFAAGGFENIAETHSEGVEVVGSYAPTDWLTLTANYAYIDAEEGDGTALIRVPRHSGDATVLVDPQGPFSGALLVRYNSEEEDFNDTVDSWVRVDLNAAYDITEHVELFGRIENLFDADYQQILGFGTLGISGSFGVRLSY